MNVMTFKGYAARIEYSDEDRCFIGHIAGIRDVVGFHGESVVELRAALRTQSMTTWPPAQSWPCAAKTFLWQVVAAR